MSDKRKKEKFAEKRRKRLDKQTAEEGAWRAEMGLPGGRVAADQSQQAPNNSCNSPPAFYEDVEFICRDCGKECVWTALQQKWYYEVAKGSLFGTAVRCRECRKKIQVQKAIQREQMTRAAEKRGR